MELEKVLETLEKLLTKWGLNRDDWILIANYAMSLLGYRVKIRKGHFNTVVNKDKLPWKSPEGFEIFPPKGSKEAREYSTWMKSTGFDTDLVAMSSREVENILKDTIFYQLPNKRKIRLLNAKGELKLLDDYLSHCTEKEVGVEKGKYLLESIKNFKKAAKEIRDWEAVVLAQKILEKYKHLRREAKIKINFKKVKELKGAIAYRGKIRGKVRKILGKGDRIGRIDKGEILVTKMTSPKFVTIIGKVSAIITNDGGTLCHAAILSREFKIPCIIGTKIATKVLKDGDLVEVDAEKGIVKIIERA